MPRAVNTESQVQMAVLDEYRSPEPDETGEPPVYRIMGIDPGSKPTACLIEGQCERSLTRVRIWEEDDLAVNDQSLRRQHAATHRRPCLRLIKTLLTKYSPDLCVVEFCWVRPRQGIVSQAKLVQAASVIHGLAYALGPTIQVMPQTWRHAMGATKQEILGHEGYLDRLHVQMTRSSRTNHTKNISRFTAAALNPRLAHLFYRVKDHGRADAFLMAVWGLRGMVHFKGDWIAFYRRFGNGPKFRQRIIDPAMDRPELMEFGADPKRATRLIEPKEWVL